MEASCRLTAQSDRRASLSVDESSKSRAANGLRAFAYSLASVRASPD
jgi:hypothetical protein